MLARCECGWSKEVDDSLAGKKAQCPKCKNSFRIQTAELISKPIEPEIVQQPIQRVYVAVPPARMDDYEEPQRTQPRQRTNVTVENHVEVQSSGNSMGIAAIILGLIALPFCWIPFLSLFTLPFSGIGLLMSAFGVIVALSRGGRGLGFPMASSLITGLAVFATLAVNFLVIGTAAVVTTATGEALQQAQEAAERTRQRREQEAMAIPAVDAQAPDPAAIGLEQPAAAPVQNAPNTAMAEKPQPGSVEPAQAPPATITAKPAEPTPEPDPVAVAEKLEKEAAGKLNLAKNLRRKNESAGNDRLKEIVEKYPGTEAAKEAAELLDK